MFCILGNFVIMIDKERIVAAISDDIAIDQVSGELTHIDVPEVLRILILS